MFCLIWRFMVVRVVFWLIFSCTLSIWSLRMFYFFIYLVSYSNLTFYSYFLFYSQFSIMAVRPANRQRRKKREPIIMAFIFP